MEGRKKINHQTRTLEPAAGLRTSNVLGAPFTGLALDNTHGRTKLVAICRQASYFKSAVREAKRSRARLFRSELRYSRRNRSKKTRRRSIALAREGETGASDGRGEQDRGNNQKRAASIAPIFICLLKYLL